MIFNADCKKGLHKDVEFNFNNVPLRIVSEFKYLGVIFHTNGKLNRMIAHRIEQTGISSLEKEMSILAI